MGRSSSVNQATTDYSPLIFKATTKLLQSSHAVRLKALDDSIQIVLGFLVVYSFSR